MILDTEITGLNYRKDEIIEIGANIGDVKGVYGGSQQPSISIPSEITRLAGISAT